MSSSAPTRQTGLDLLRSIAMLMIVIWHFSLHIIGSNPFPTSPVGLGNYLVLEFLLVCCSVCVNVFILISSYFLVDKPFNGARMLQLWLQVVFYSAGISLLFFFLNPGSLSGKELLKSFFPVSNNRYWFVSIYFAYACLAPFLSRIARTLSRRDYQVLLLVLIAFCCTFALNIPLGNLMGASKGYSLLWFIALFFWGGYFKRFNIHTDSGRLLYYYFGLALIVTLLYVTKNFFRIKGGEAGPIIELSAYNGLAFLLSIPLFLYFLKADFNQSFLVRSLTATAPYAFGVYLIHEHLLLRGFLWGDSFSWLSYLDRPWWILLVLGFVIVLYFLCAGIDFLRAKVFSALGVPERCSRVWQSITEKVNSIQQHYDR